MLSQTSTNPLTTLTHNIVRHVADSRDVIQG